MSTENGIPTLGTARGYTERLREKIEYLDARVAERVAAGQVAHYEAAELAALRWLLPLAEAEVDFIRRLREEVIPAEIAAHRGRPEEPST